LIKSKINKSEAKANKQQELKIDALRKDSKNKKKSLSIFDIDTKLSVKNSFCIVNEEEEAMLHTTTHVQTTSILSSIENDNNLMTIFDSYTAFNFYSRPMSKLDYVHESESKIQTSKPTVTCNKYATDV
jgi:hypothetical protein